MPLPKRPAGLPGVCLPAITLARYKSGVIPSKGKTEIMDSFEDAFPKISRDIFRKYVAPSKLYVPTPKEHAWIVDIIDRYFVYYQGEQHPITTPHTHEAV